MTPTTTTNDHQTQISDVPEYIRPCIADGLDKISRATTFTDRDVALADMFAAGLVAMSAWLYEIGFDACLWERVLTTGIPAAVCRAICDFVDSGGVRKLYRTRPDVLLHVRRVMALMLRRLETDASATQ